MMTLLVGLVVVIVMALFGAIVKVTFDIAADSGNAFLSIIGFIVAGTIFIMSSYYELLILGKGAIALFHEDCNHKSVVVQPERK